LRETVLGGIPHLTQFSIQALIRHIRRKHFTGLNRRIHFYFVTNGPLACSCPTSQRDASIFVHQPLNEPTTPDLVIEYLIKHQLLHMQLPHWETKWHLNEHSYSFWEAEKTISPHRRDAQSWIVANFFPWLVRPRLGMMRLKSNWKEVQNLSRMTIYESRQFCGAGDLRTW